MRKAKPKPRASRKATTVQLRLRPAEKAVIALAAELRQTTLSKFMLERAYQAAQKALADQVHFALPPGHCRLSRKPWTLRRVRSRP